MTGRDIRDTDVAEEGRLGAVPDGVDDDRGNRAADLFASGVDASTYLSFLVKNFFLAVRAGAPAWRLVAILDTTIAAAVRHSALERMPASPAPESLAAAPVGYRRAACFARLYDLRDHLERHGAVPAGYVHAFDDLVIGIMCVRPASDGQACREALASTR